MSIAVSKTIPSLKKFDTVHVGSKKYTVRLAQNREELDKAFALRFQVFNLELGEGLSGSYMSQRDVDDFDKQFDHLIVIENATQDVIGTYRIQDCDRAEANLGYYSAQEFAVHLLPSRILLNAVELGRACIHEDHRNGRVLYLLWKGIAQYIFHSGKQFLFGCCSIPSQDAREGWAYYKYLNTKQKVDTDMLVPVEPGYECPQSVNINPMDIKLPNLFQLYLQLGAKVHSLPALDNDFKTIDFFIMLDLQEVSSETKRLFF